MRADRAIANWNKVCIIYREFVSRFGNQSLLSVFRWLFVAICVNLPQCCMSPCKTFSACLCDVINAERQATIDPKKRPPSFSRTSTSIANRPSLFVGRRVHRCALAAIKNSAFVRIMQLGREMQVPFMQSAGMCFVSLWFWHCRVCGGCHCLPPMGRHPFAHKCFTNSSISARKSHALGLRPEIT